MLNFKPLDDAFSQFIRTRSNWRCDECGRLFESPNKGLLHCSHLYTRGYKSVRCDEDNAFAHCFKCHAWFEGHPIEFHEWALGRLGASKYDALRIRSVEMRKFSQSEVNELAVNYRRAVREM